MDHGTRGLDREAWMDVNVAQPPIPSHGHGRPEVVGMLAGHVLGLLRVRDARGAEVGPTRVEMLTAQVVKAALSPDAAALDALADTLAADSVGMDAICDRLLPAAARELGRAWEDDRVSFVDVSLAMLRIQRFVRDVMRAGVPCPARIDASLMLVLPKGEQHSFGMVVAAGRLQRIGVPVTLEIGSDAEDVCARIRAGACDALLVSVGSENTLPAVRRLVDRLRATMPAPPPVLLGGALISEMDAAALRRVEAQTGVRLATADLHSALRCLKETVAAFHGLETV
jgi:methylmalonyl-CoA mutase cobalamin-binding subunit